MAGFCLKNVPARELEIKPCFHAVGLAWLLKLWVPCKMSLPAGFIKPVTVWHNCDLIFCAILLKSPKLVFQCISAASYATGLWRAVFRRYKPGSRRELCTGLWNRCKTCITGFIKIDMLSPGFTANIG